MGKSFLNKTIKLSIKDDKPIFVPFIMAGDGGINRLEKDILFLQNCGVTAIEIGIPFSDPIADGPTIQSAGKRALENGTILEDILQVLKSFKQKRTIPIIIMSYMNPIYVYGIDSFAKQCKRSGISGVIIPDVPLEEETIITKHLQTYNLAHIRLAAVTNSLERNTEIAKRSDGFLYAVTMTGTTGGEINIDETLKIYLQQLKQVSPVPVLAGFGVSTSEHVQTFNNLCDGVIVGSQIVKYLQDKQYGKIKHLVEKSIS